MRIPTSVFCRFDRGGCSQATGTSRRFDLPVRVRMSAVHVVSVCFALPRSRWITGTVVRGGGMAASAAAGTASETTAVARARRRMAGLYAGMPPNGGQSKPGRPGFSAQGDSMHAPMHAFGVHIDLAVV
jgi:hypothetical protein